MKEEFFAWYPRTPDELAQLWARAIFVPDANVLLHCFRHASKVREDLLRILELLSDSLWIPYQVGLEFHRNRLDVEVGAVDAYDRLAKDYDGIVNQAKEKLRQLRSHPAIDIESELAALDMFSGDFKKRLERAKSAHPTEALSATLSKLTAILRGRVGAKPTTEQINSIKKEGEDRYAKKIPPGYKDAKKDGGDMDKYGDLIIWKAMMEKAKSDKRPVIFISDDAKDDWWNIHRGRKLGARPELLDEFRAVTGQDFHIYELPQFLNIAAERNASIRQEGIAEIQKSVLEEKQARQIESSNSQIRELEVQRELLISVLAGVPMAENKISGEAEDKELVRLRLLEIDEALKVLRTEDKQNDSIDAAGERS